VGVVSRVSVTGIVVCVLCGSLLVGCGERLSAEDQVRGTVKALVEARDRRDAAVECALLSPRAQRGRVAIAQRLQTDPAYGDVVVDRSRLARTCVEASRAAGAAGPREPTVTKQPGAFDALASARVAVRDDVAVVSGLRLPLLSASRLRLVRVDGSWRIDEPLP
jgi:hypothetical protein